MFKGKRIFISGGNGVIGKELVSKLHEVGALLFVGDLKPRPITWPKTIRYRQGDLNYISSEELLSFKPQIFFHLAATFERSTETYDFWYENHHHNTTLGTYLMTILKDCSSLEKVINCSSYLIYDKRLYSFDKPQEFAYRLSETDPINPRNLTGVAKLYHEIELRFLDGFRRAQFKSVSARIYRSYGKNSRDIISRWIRALLKGETITVYRKEGRFDFIYAGEVAEGLIQLALNENAEGILNLGNDNSRAIADVLSILQLYFPDMKTEENEIDIPYEASQANMDNFQKVIGWKPEMQLEDAIPLMIEHEKGKLDPSTDIEDTSNVLVTSISKKVPLLQSLKKAADKFGNDIKIYGGDIDQNCIGAGFVDFFWHMPRLNDLGVEQIVEYCSSNNINTIIPTRDGELIYWASLKKILSEKGINIMVAGADPVEICLDKLFFFKSDISKDFPIIPTSDNIDEITASQFVVKERFGAGAKSIGLRLTKEAALEHARKLETPIFQPFIEGQEISVDLYIESGGKTKGVIARTRDVVVNGESQITSTIVDKELERLCSNLAEKIGLRGHAIFQLIKDENQHYHFIECNPRFGGASTLSIAAGLDSFYWFILESNGVDIQEYPFVRKVDKLKLVRFPSDKINYDTCI